ncbi:MAG: DUF262 domain-containing protein [Calditrichaeota bacterium]|nr:MAG: DUF262 domain-containing protein [Calditrichota bacterium]
MQQPENRSRKYTHLFTEIDTGRIKIPQFQRDFVWDKEQTARLLDSLIKGFPIGTFIFWKTKEKLREVRDIGNVSLPATPPGEFVYYVLDGQQRITSLYAVRKGIRLNKNGKTIDYHDIVIDLDADPDSEDPVVFTTPPENHTTIAVYELLNAPIDELAKKYPAFLTKIATYQNRLQGYDFSVVEIADYPIDIACEIFTRINTGGTELTLFEIMVAKTYDLPRGFDLAHEYEWLIDNNGAKEKDLEDAGFETVPPSTVLQCVAMNTGEGRVRRRDILAISRDDFIDTWPVVKEGLFYAVDYVRTRLRIPVSRLLPYHTLLVPLTYFFVQNKGKSPTSRQHKLLTQYFWWASLSSRFSSAVESKLFQDRQRMDAILRGEQPDYRGEELNITLDDLRWRWFSTGDAFSMAIICLYAWFQPHSFDTDALVKLDNSWLKVANSRNYHHFFPKAWLRKQGYEDWQANSVLNITLVDDFLNKRKIRARAPGDYMREFADQNPNIAKTMQTHLIDDLDAAGIWENDYERFIEHRGRRVLEELKKRLQPDLEK